MGDGYISDHVVTAATVNTAAMVLVASVGCVPDVRGGVYSGVARGTLGDAGSVVDDVFVAA